MKIDLNCTFGGHSTEFEVPIPEGWHVEDRYVEDALCPDHAKARGFFDTQCPGCVSGWGECGLWRSFMFSGRQRTISAQDMTVIAGGRCPYRVNGTFMATGSEFGEMDLSENASAEAGAAMLRGIQDYIERYP